MGAFLSATSCTFWVTLLEMKFMIMSGWMVPQPPASFACPAAPSNNVPSAIFDQVARIVRSMTGTWYM